jgi:8-oxo-dGTP pyrophosphatase MutT (NUDIX family)
MKKTYIGVYGLAIDHQRVLLTLKAKGPYVGLWDLIGGGLEFGESIEEALRREFKEEVAMQFDEMHWLQNQTYTIQVENTGQTFYHIGLIYRINNLKVIENQEAEDEFFWADLNQLSKEKLTPFAYQALKTLPDLF